MQFVGRPVEAVEVSISLVAATAASSSQDHLSIEVVGDQVSHTCVEAINVHFSKGILLPSCAFTKSALCCRCL